MHQSIRNAIGVAAAIAILVGAYGVVSVTRSYDGIIQIRSDLFLRDLGSENYRRFTTSGEGRVTAIPDVAQFRYTVRTEGGRDVAKIQQENAGKANRAIAFVKAQGVAPKDIHTISYRVDPRYQQFPCERKPGDDRPCRPPELQGYTVWQAVVVRVRDFGKVGDVISGVVREGANEVSEISFTVDDPIALQQQARAQAIGQAKEKARAIAAAGDFRLGRLLAIDEGFSGPVVEQKNYALEAAGRNVLAPIAPDIEPGSQEIIVTVTLKYDIE